ncbi:MAG: tetratricopeptide repeat protein [Burkholderiaceae bacterium]
MQTNRLILTIIAAALAGCASTQPSQPKVRLDPSELGRPALIKAEPGPEIQPGSSQPVVRLSHAGASAPGAVGTSAATGATTLDSTTDPAAAGVASPTATGSETVASAVPADTVAVEDVDLSRAGTMQAVSRITNGVSPAQAAYISGKQALGQRDFGQAVEFFSSAKRLDPTLVDAYVGLGVAHSMSGSNDQAIAEFETAVRLEPENARWHSNLGMAYARTGQFVPAQQALARAWSLKPGDARIEAQLQRVTAAVKSVGVAPSVGHGPVSVVPQESADEKQLVEVKERVFDLKLTGVTDAEMAAPAVSIAAAPLTGSAPMHRQVTAPAKPRSVLNFKPGTGTVSSSSNASAAPKPSAVVPVIDSLSKQAPAAERTAVNAPITKSAPIPKLTPVVARASASMPAKPVTTAQKPSVVALAVKRQQRQVKSRAIPGMFVVAPSKEAGTRVARFLAKNGFRAAQVGNATDSQPLTEIHYRPGFEGDVHDIRQALPVRAYSVAQTELPAGVNVRLIVGRDMRAVSENEGSGS